MTMMAYSDHSNVLGRTEDASIQSANGGTTMSLSAVPSPRLARENARRADQRDYRLLYTLTSPLFFTIASLSFLLPRALASKLSGLDVHGSVFARARELANNTLPYTFMG